MPRRRNWKLLRETVLEARERMIREGVGLRAFIDPDMISVKWVEDKAVDADRLSDEDRRGPGSAHWNIAGGVARIYPDGGCLTDHDPNSPIKNKARAWLSFTELHVAVRTWDFLLKALKEGHLAVPVEDKKETLVDADLVTHSDLELMRSHRKSAADGEVEFRSDQSGEPMYDPFVGNHLNIVVGTIGTGCLDDGPVYGGGLGLVDGAATSRSALGILWGRAVLIEEKAAKRFVESFTNKDLVEHTPDDELARRIVDLRRRYPDAARPYLLRLSGVDVLSRSDQDVIWERAKTLAADVGVDMPRPGRPARSRGN